MGGAGEAQVLRRGLMLVDDDADLLESLGDILGDLFHAVHIETAPNAMEAMRKMEGAPVHVLLTDQNMPGLAGLELIEWARQRHPGTHCVLMSAAVEETLSVEAAALGAAFFAKPLALADLARHLHTALADDRGG
ncbi:MAG: response regulator transcription factor [Thermoplasmatota archaeon]